MVTTLYESNATRIICKEELRADHSGCQHFLFLQFQSAEQFV